MSEPGSQHYLCSSGLNPNANQNLATASTAEIRFVLDSNRRDALLRTGDKPPELQQISRKYYCHILVEDSTLVVKWTSIRLPPESLIKLVAGEVETFIRNAVEHDELTCPNFTTTVFCPEILNQGYQSSLAECKNSKIEQQDNGWQVAVVTGTNAEVNESRKRICEIVTQYTDEKLVVNEDQCKFVDVALQCSDSFLVNLLADTNTAEVHTKACRYICLSGHKAEVDIVAERIVKVISKLEKVLLPFPAFVVNWLNRKNNLDILQQRLIQRNIVIVLQATDEFLYACSDDKINLEAAAGILENELAWQPVEVVLDQSFNLLKADHHKSELSRILHSNAEVVLSEKQIWHLICWQKDVYDITKNLGNFFKKNTLVKRKVECSEAHIAFVNQYLETDFKAITELTDQSNSMKLEITSYSDGFALVGNTELVDCGEEKLSQLIKKIQKHLYAVDIVPNAQELLKGRVSTIGKQTGTIIRLLDPDLLDAMTRYPSVSEHAEGKWSSQEHSEAEGYKANATDDLVILPAWSKLCDVKADILVNSIDWTLDLTLGTISESLSQVAGPSLQQELYRRYPRGIEFFCYAVTKSYNIGCRAIIHVACAQHCGKYTEDMLLLLFVDCLNEAEKRRAASIAFPAIGTGLLNYPPATVFKLLHEAVAIFRKRHKTTSLEKVYCSLMDPKHRELFAECIKADINRGIQKKSSSKAKAPESPALCIATKKTYVQILKDIPSRKLHMAIHFDCSGIPRKGTAPSGKQHGSLHIDKNVDISKLPSALESAISSCESFKATSLSIFAHKDDKITARCITEVIRNYCESGGGTITEISLIVTDDQLFTYCQCLLATWFQPTYPLNKAPDKAPVRDTLTRLPFVGPLLSLLIGESPKSCDAIDDAAAIAIYGTSREQIQEAEVLLSNVLSQECVIKDFACDTEDLSILQDKQINAIVAIGPLFNTRISVHLEQKKIFIRGCRKEDVDLAREKVKDFVTSAKQEFYQSEIKRQILERAKLQVEHVQWQYQDDSGMWTNFDEISSMSVEDSCLKGTECSLQTAIGELAYDPVNSPTVAVVVGGSRRKECRIRRIDVKEWRLFPKEWIYCEEYCEHILSKDTAEYTAIESEFLNDAGASANEVIEIKRIQDPPSRKMFKIQQDRVQRSIIDKFGPCTRRLWHGTSSETASAITGTHFNRSFVGREVLYGKGVYFARDASYAAQSQYARASGGTRTIILAEVITGCFTKGDPLMTVPPKRLDSTGLSYDTTVDDENDPSIFVVYHDSQAYPLYVLKFK